ncbi:MAG: carbamoyl-phosphate synthase large subunit, partial [Actinomycetes bacterium]
MPLREELRSVLVVGSGPIVIGQAAEFDYSGTQACRALRGLGLRVVLVNSNPATIMTDPEVADATYLEPLTPGPVAAVLEAERPDALLPTLGGQTALNLAVALHENGTLERLGVELIGATVDAVRRAESRVEFTRTCRAAGLDLPRGVEVGSVAEGLAEVEDLGLPVVLRPSFTLGGWGGGIARSFEELARLLAEGLVASPVGRVLIEESVLGWKEFELEVMRDGADNAVIVCSIENVDPMGVHTGDSITVAPAQTLSDVEYQEMRDAAFACIRRVGVETGGSNVQFAVDPRTGEQVVIEMNPRVSRSSALASKATGFPIAKIATKLAVGYTLDEVTNDITGETPASFEPTIDYVVTKVPRWAFEKFPGSPGVLGTSMQSVGEAMAIGRTFPESLQKALRSLEHGRRGLNCDPAEAALDALDDDELVRLSAIATPDRPFQLEAALRRGISVDRLYEATRVDPWFLDQLLHVTEERAVLAETGFEGMTTRAWRRAKRLGFSDGQLAWLWDVDESAVRSRRKAAGVSRVYKTVDTCGAEFEAHTPYHYATFEDEDEVRVTGRRTVVILGSGPNR